MNFTSNDIGLGTYLYKFFLTLKIINVFVIQINVSRPAVTKKYLCLKNSPGDTTFIKDKLIAKSTHFTRCLINIRKSSFVCCSQKIIHDSYARPQQYTIYLSQSLYPTVLPVTLNYQAWRSRSYD